jgi:hypothetical protein
VKGWLFQKTSPQPSPIGRGNSRSPLLIGEDLDEVWKDVAKPVEVIKTSGKTYSHYYKIFRFNSFEILDVILCSYSNLK